MKVEIQISAQVGHHIVGLLNMLYQAKSWETRKVLVQVYTILSEMPTYRSYGMCMKWAVSTKNSSGLDSKVRLIRIF